MTEHATQDRLQTSYTEVELKCPRCGSKWSPTVANFINFGTDPKGREGLLRKTVHHSYCPRCKKHMEIDHIFSVYDPDERLLVQVRPAWEFKAGGGEEYYWKRLEDLVLKYADEDLRVDVVFGFDELIEKHLGGEEAREAALARAQAEKEAGLEPGSLTEERDGTQTA